MDSQQDQFKIDNDKLYDYYPIHQRSWCSPA